MTDWAPYWYHGVAPQGEGEDARSGRDSHRSVPGYRMGPDGGFQTMYVLFSSMVDKANSAPLFHLQRIQIWRAGTVKKGITTRRYGAKDPEELISVPKSRWLPVSSVSCMLVVHYSALSTNSYAKRTSCSSLCLKSLS